MSRKKRLGVLRNTSDDDMTLGELMGLPDLSDDEATTLFLNQMPTGSAAKKYRERQLTSMAKAPLIVWFSFPAVAWQDAGRKGDLVFARLTSKILEV